MNDKKNIDRLFQEKFKDFESEPNQYVWKKIEAALKENKKDKKIIPFWFKRAGIAAALFIGALALNSLFNVGDNENNIVLENKTKNSLNSIPEDSIKIKNRIETRNSENEVVLHNSEPLNPKIKIIENGSTIKENKKENDFKLLKNKTELKNTIHSKSEVVNNDFEVNNIKSEKILNEDRNSNLKYKNYRKISNNNLTVINENSKNLNNKFQISSTNKSLKNTFLRKQAATNSKIINQENAFEENGSLKFLEKNNIIKQKIENEVAVINSKQDEKKLDSTAIAALVPNALEELLKKNEEEKVKIVESKMDRWRITSNVAPIYFSSATNGSPIDEEFSKNGKTFENNVSVGLGINYAISKKITLRTGLNKFTLGYNTNGIVFQPGIESKGLENISSSVAGASIELSNRNLDANFIAFDNEFESVGEGEINQRMGYYEVPLEMSFSVLNKKFGVDLIGGISTLFLNENKIALVSSTLSTDLGKANNLSNIHFSTNVGLGFRYKFLKSFEAKFEPTFKYQINTFTKDAGSFKPYFIGLYSGISFSF